MIINALLAFVLVRWSRLSESKRRPIHYEVVMALATTSPMQAAGLVVVREYLYRTANAQSIWHGSGTTLAGAAIDGAP
jgi:hypothetical protein